MFHVVQPLKTLRNFSKRHFKLKGNLFYKNVIILLFIYICIIKLLSSLIDLVLKDEFL